jgi:hypothetical protein
VERLQWSDTILDDARRVLRRVERELTRARVAGEVVVTGPASMPGVLTKGDLDLQLRVPPDQFDVAVRRLSEIYARASVHAWAATLAVFDVSAAEPAGLAVTPIGSPHDRRFTSTWLRLRSEPDLLREYNTIKTDFYGTAEYESRKSAFFDKIADA